MRYQRQPSMLILAPLAAQVVVGAQLFLFVCFEVIKVKVEEMSYFETTKNDVVVLGRRLTLFG